MVPESIGFFDIHSHLLPGVDDGAQNMDDALALLSQAKADGTEAMVLTPHYRGRFRQNTPQQLDEIFRQLCLQAPEGMKLYLGNEAGYERDLADKLSEKTVLSINGGRYVLLEFSTETPKSLILDGVYEVLNAGFTPIIAHVERYASFRRHKALADETLDAGALFQINADSILGRCGRDVKRYCHYLLKRQMVHFIASDSHDQIHRPPLLSECYRRICKKYGPEYAACLFRENARIVLRGTEG